MRSRRSEAVDTALDLLLLFALLAFFYYVYFDQGWY